MISSKVLLSLILIAPLVMCGQAPPSIQASLAAKHVGTSVPELVSALQNPDPEVRTMAAMELASEGHKEEAPSLRAAMSRETDINARVGIARALLLMGDPQAERAVTDICIDKNMSWYLRLLAASSLPEPQEKCVGAISSELSNPSASTAVNGMLAYLTRIAPKITASPELSHLLTRGAQRALNDDVASTRQQAVKLILAYHLTGALPALRRASSTEKDAGTLALLKNAISTLS